MASRCSVRGGVGYLAERLKCTASQSLHAAPGVAGELSVESVPPRYRPMLGGASGRPVRYRCSRGVPPHRTENREQRVRTRVDGGLVPGRTGIERLEVFVEG